ncbi:MAG: hypothetical protein SGPRY_000761 [Prymnesium sp.]
MNALQVMFALLHQLMEIIIAVSIGRCFRAQPLDVTSQQALAGSNLIARRPTLDLSSVDSHNETDEQMPAMLIVLNPGDVEEELPSVEQRVNHAAVQEEHRDPRWCAVEYILLRRHIRAAESLQMALSEAHEALHNDSAARRACRSFDGACDNHPCGFRREKFRR